MNKVKVRVLTIASLVVMLIAVLALAVCSVIPRRTAQAVTEVEYEPSAVFAAGVGGEVGASEGENPYIEFSLADGGKTHFRRDLALKWFSADDSAESASSVVKPGKANYFSMQFSCPSVDFETFTISFESAEESVSEEEKAVNDLVFRMTDGTLQVAVKSADNRDAELADLEWNDLATGASAEVSVSFAEGVNIGEFALHVSCGETTVRPN